MFERIASKWRAHEVVEPGQSHHVRAIRAAGMRIQPAQAGQPTNLRAVAAARQEWQKLAWRYRDCIPELRFAIGYRSAAISRIRMYPALIINDDDEPAPLSLLFDKDPKKREIIDIDARLAKAAQELLDRLPLSDGFGFVGVLSENFDVAGDCWLHGRTDADGDETWQIRSVDEVRMSADGRMMKIDDDDNPGTQRDIDWTTEELYRLWVPHPRKQILPDSPCQAALDTFEDIVLYGREQRAASRSRIGANGVLMFPNNMTMQRNTGDEVDGVPVNDNAFMGDFTAAVLSPITNEGDAGSVVPLVLTGDAEDIKAVRHLVLTRESSDKLEAKLEAALRRMARGMDLPPEVISGLGDANHWSAWQIDASTFRYHLEPGVRRMVDSITVAYLRTNLIADGFDRADVARIRIWYDAGAITENPNRRQDAIDAYKLGVIGGDPTRQALGFNDGDAPSDDELLRMLLMRTGFDPLTASQLVQRTLTPSEPIVLPTRETVAIGDKTGAPADGATKQVTEPGQAPPSTGVPDTAPPGLQAGGDILERLANKLSMATLNAYEDADYNLVFEEMHEIVRIEQALRERIVRTADAMLTRAVEKGANKLRAKLSSDKALIEQLRGMDVEQFGAFIGRERALTAGATTDFLIAGAFAVLGEKFTQWTLAAIDAIAARVVRMLGLPKGSAQANKVTDRVRHDMANRVHAGWQRLNHDLEGLADKVLYGKYSPPTDGELSDTRVPPGMVRAVLADIGGKAEGGSEVSSKGRSSSAAAGLATGSTVGHVLAEHGAAELGYLWVYGVTLAPDNFIPHLNIEGIRFADWSDPQLETPTGYKWIGDYMFPGDHDGCMCDYVPAYAIPKYGKQVANRLAEPSRDMSNIIMLATMDDNAGRKNTTAQALRDQYNRIQKLQSRFINGGKVAS